MIYVICLLHCKKIFLYPMQITSHILFGKDFFPGTREGQECESQTLGFLVNWQLADFPTCCATVPAYLNHTENISKFGDGLDRKYVINIGSDFNNISYLTLIELLRCPVNYEFVQMI